jgi:hypothetical protein
LNPKRLKDVILELTILFILFIRQVKNTHQRHIHALSCMHVPQCGMRRKMKWHSYWNPYIGINVHLIGVCFLLGCGFHSLWNLYIFWSGQFDFHLWRRMLDTVLMDWVCRDATDRCFFSSLHQWNVLPDIIDTILKTPLHTNNQDLSYYCYALLVIIRHLNYLVMSVRNGGYCRNVSCALN